MVFIIALNLMAGVISFIHSVNERESIMTAMGWGMSCIINIGFSLHNIKKYFRVE